MIRLAVYAQREEFHRRLWRAVGDSPDLRIDLRYRSVTEITSAPAADLVVLLEPPVAAVERISVDLPADAGIVVLADGALREALHAVVYESQRAHALLSADAEVETVLAAVRSVGEGLFVSDEPGPRPSALSAGQAAIDPGRPTLTDRELQVLHLLANGLSNRAIGESLDLSENTVKYHLAGLYGALNVHTRGEALLEAVRHGLISI